MGGLLPWLPLALQSHQAARAGAVSGFLATSSATRRTGPPVRRLLPLAGDAQTPLCPLISSLSRSLWEMLLLMTS